MRQEKSIMHKFCATKEIKRIFLFLSLSILIVILPQSRMHLQYSIRCYSSELRASYILPVFHQELYGDGQKLSFYENWSLNQILPRHLNLQLVGD